PPLELRAVEDLVANRCQEREQRTAFHFRAPGSSKTQPLGPTVGHAASLGSHWRLRGGAGEPTPPRYRLRLQVGGEDLFAETEVDQVLPPVGPDRSHVASRRCDAFVVSVLV